MKYNIVLIVLILVGAGCTNEKTTEQHLLVSVSTVADVTEYQVLMPKANPLLQLFHCETNPNTECVFRLRSISDRLLTPVFSCRLADGAATEKQNTEDDPQFRNKNITAFYKRVRQLVNDFYEQRDANIPLQNSECIRTICDELQYLSEDTSTRKFLTVFSDLNEKSDLYDVYQSPAEAGTTIERILMRKEMMPERLNGITVFFVFSPIDRKQDMQYRQIVEAYKRVIETRGGKVLIQADNEVFDL